MKALPLGPIAEVQSDGVSLKSHYDASALAAVAALWRSKWWLLAIVVCALVAALAIIPTLDKKYAADALIQLDLGQAQPSPLGAAANLALDPAAIVESEARIIRSRTIARRVATELDLINDPAFAPGPSRSEAILDLIRRAGQRILPADWLPPDASGQATDADDDARRLDLVVAEVMKGLEVHNDTRSYLITVVYTSSTPEKAARIANAFADAYLRSRLEASFESAQRASEWLSTQVSQVRSALAEADRAVQEFRVSTGFLEADAEGASVQEQTLLELNTQLIAAGNHRAEQMARLARAREALAEGNVSLTSDLAVSPIIQGLIENEIAARNELTRLSLAYGERHPLAAQAQANVAEIHARLVEELEATVASIEDEVAAATANEERLSERVASLQREMIETKAQEQELYNLQVHADGLRDRLQALVENQERTEALAELPAVTANLVVAAEPVALPSSPKPKVILALTGLVALAGGVGLVLLLEQRDTGFRTDTELSSELNVPCLGMIPYLPKHAQQGARLAFREAARSVLASGVKGGSGKAEVVLVTSALPGEGKTVLTYALAGCAISSRRSVLIIEVGSKEGGQTPPYSRVTLNLQEILAEDDKRRPLLAAQTREQPVVIRCDRPLQNLEEILSSPSFESMLDHARSIYDIVLVEVPSVILYADALVFGRYADVVFQVVRWSNTPKSAVRAAARRLSTVGLQVNGAVLTQVDVRKHKRYAHRDEIYFRKRYAEGLDRTSWTGRVKRLMGS